MVSAPVSVLPASAAYEMFTRSRFAFVKFELLKFAFVRLDPDKSRPVKIPPDKFTLGPKI